MKADVVVVGGGPAGIAAAVSAAASGCSVTIVDEGPAPGGQIWRGNATTRMARAWQRRFAASGAKFIGGTTVVDAVTPHTLIAERDGEPLTLRATRAVIIATGARELFLPFPGWTLPGVVGVGGAQALLKRGWHVEGRRAVVAGSGPLLLAVAAGLSRAGADVRLIVEQVPGSQVRRFARGLWRTPVRLATGAQYRWAARRAPYLTSSWVTRAEGNDRVRSVQVAGPRERSVECDVLCVAYGLVGATELPRLLGCAVTSRGVTVDEIQQTTVEGVFCAGESVAIGGVDAALVQGRIAGLVAAGQAGQARRLWRERARHAAFAARLRVAFAIRPELCSLVEDDTIVCRCEDVRWSRIADCDTPREARLHTRVGMGACQGRVCGAALRHLKGWSEGAARPPISPADIHTLIHAGHVVEEHAEE